MSAQAPAQPVDVARSNERSSMRLNARAVALLLIALAVMLLAIAPFLERIARECLGMVKPGETAFVVVPAHGKPDPPDC